LDDDFGNIRDHYSPIDSLYFSIVTVTTVGYGDLKPAYQFEKFFVTFYALFGVSIIGNIMIAWITEKQRVMAAKMKEAQKQQTAKMMSMRSDQGSVKTAHSKRAEEGASKLKDIMNCKGMKKAHADVLKILSRLLCTIIVVATIVELAEGWGPLDSFYYCVITATSVGYGDFYPTHEPDRLMACLYIPIFIIQLAAFLQAIAKMVASGATANLEESGGMKPFTLDEEKVEEMAAFGGHKAVAGESAKIPLLTFMKFVLVQSGKIDDAGLTMIAKNFVKLSGGDGSIDKEDLARVGRAAARRQAPSDALSTGTGAIGKVSA
jgi:potassium channel subfamily K